jgi:glycerol kinase
MVRAALEAIAFQSAEVLRSMASDTGQSLSALRIDGGASANNFLCQFQADLLGLPVTRPQVIETTAMGAAFLAGLATGVWRDQEQIQTLWQEDRTFTPQLERNVADARLAEWSRAVERAKGWIPSTNL